MTQHAGEGEPFGASRSGEEDAGLSESPRHECGVFGVFGNPEATTLTYLGLYALQHRGQEGAGIVSCDGDTLRAARGKAVERKLPSGETRSQFVSDLYAFTVDGDTITGTATGFNDLDEILSGLQPSTLNILGARPAMGKCVAWDTPMVDPRTGAVLPAMGYGAAQTADLAATLNAADADLILSATPIDLRRVMTLDKPVVRVRYELEQTEGMPLAELLAPIVVQAGGGRLMVAPATPTGRPASRLAMWATLRLSSPAWFAQPMMTSSRAAKSPKCLLTLLTRITSRPSGG